MRLKIVLIIIAITVLLCIPWSIRTLSGFGDLQLTKGMARTEVEKQLGRILDGRVDYSPYGNNLKGGTVKYRKGIFVLDVLDAPGAPAPYAASPNGQVKHFPPVDEAVLTHRIRIMLLGLDFQYVAIFILASMVVLAIVKRKSRRTDAAADSDTLNTDMQSDGSR